MPGHVIDIGAGLSYSMAGLLECMHFPVRSHVAIDSSRMPGTEVTTGDEPRTVEHESMPIPEQPKPRDEIASLPQGANAPVAGGWSGRVELGRVADGAPKAGQLVAKSSGDAARSPPDGRGLSSTRRGAGRFRDRRSDWRGGDGCGLSRAGHEAGSSGCPQATASRSGADPEVVARFYQEGRSAARLDHENIARVYSIGQHGAFHFIAFEFIDGETVRQRPETAGPLPVSEAVHVALEIAQALVHASERGVVHRDIKPSNIIITSTGRAKLVDMGLARRFERGGDNGLTQSGMTLGTFDYISPEQARDPRDVDVRSDLYSLGCTSFRC